MRPVSVLCFALAILWAGSSSAISLGLGDDFSSLAFWQRGGLAVPGPGGAGDSFLLLSADSVSQGGNLVTFNQAQWAGDYVGAGVARIRLSLKNLGSEPLDIRLALGDANAPRLGGSWYATTQAIHLDPGSGWVEASFALGSSDLVLTNGSASHAQVMGNVVTLRVLHASSPSAFGDPVIGMLGIDAITALTDALDSDADGSPDDVDNCAQFANPGQEDADANGIGDACECGDQDGDGRVTVSDLIAINLAIFDPAQVTPLCDANEDGRCDVSDIIGANLKIFGQPAYCARYPSPHP